MAKQKTKQEEVKAENVEQAQGLVIAKKSPLETFGILKEQLDQIKAVQETPYKTGGVVKIQGREIKIKEEKSLLKLIELAGNVVMYKQLYSTGVTALGLDKEDTKYPAAELDGLSLDDVMHDIQLRKDVVTFEDKKAKLEKAMSKISGYFSKEDKMALDLAEIQNDLGIDLENL